MQGFLGVPLTSADRIKERRKVIQANSRSKQPQEFPAGTGENIVHDIA